MAAALVNALSGDTRNQPPPPSRPPPARSRTSTAPGGHTGAEDGLPVAQQHAEEGSQALQHRRQALPAEVPLRSPARGSVGGGGS